MNSLRDICDYVVTRTNIIENYISTENMLPNKGGVCDTLKVPSGGIGTKYQVGDILISNIRPYFKKIWQADCEGACSTDVLCLRANENVDSRFLYYLLTQQSFFDYVMSGTKGCKMPRGDKQQIMQWHIHLPSLVEQKKIAGVLSTLDAKIQLNRRINDNLEQQAQALYKSWFVDFEPFKDSDFVESDLGLIPKGWSTGRIYKYVNVIYGAPYKSTLFNENKEGYPLIRIRDLKTFSPQFYTTEVLPQTEYIKSGDVVAGMDAEFIPCLWQGETGVLNQRCCKFVGKDKDINNLFVLNLVKPELEYVQRYKTGTTVSHLGKADIDRFIVILPDEVIVHQFSKICRSLLDEQNKCALEIRRLTNLRDTLLPKLMSGELKINEIDC